MARLVQHRLLMLLVLSALMSILPGVHSLAQSRAQPQSSEGDLQRRLAQKEQSNERLLQVSNANARLLDLSDAIAFCNAWIDNTQPASNTVTVTVTRTAKTVRAATVSTTSTQTNTAFSTLTATSTAFSTATATQTILATATSTSIVSVTNPNVVATATTTSFPSTKTLGDGILVRRETDAPSTEHWFRPGREPKLPKARRSLYDEHHRHHRRAADVDCQRKMTTKRKTTTTHKATSKPKSKPTSTHKPAPKKTTSSSKGKAKVTAKPKTTAKTTTKPKATAKTTTKHKVAKPAAFRLIPDDVLTDACLVVIYGFSAYPDFTTTSTKAVATRTVAAVTNTIFETATTTLPTTVTVTSTQPVTTTVLSTSTLSVTATTTTTLFTPTTTTKTVLATATAYAGKGYLKYDAGGYAAANALDDSYLPRAQTLLGIKVGALNVRFEASSGKLYTPSGKVANIDSDEGFFAVYFDPPANLAAIGAAPLICAVDANTAELTCKAGTGGASRFYSCSTPGLLGALIQNPNVFLGGPTQSDPNCSPLKITFTP